MLAVVHGGHQKTNLYFGTASKILFCSSTLLRSQPSTISRASTECPKSRRQERHEAVVALAME
jgi:hypothetical protein